MGLLSKLEESVSYVEQKANGRTAGQLWKEGRRARLTEPVSIADSGAVVAARSNTDPVLGER